METEAVDNAGVRPSHGCMAVRDRFSDLKERVKTESPLIVDGGASRGDMVNHFLYQYRSPIIHAFEPIPEMSKALSKRFPGVENLVVHEKALGAENGVFTFNVMNDTVTSSFFAPSEINRGYHGLKVEVNRKIKVAQVRLDNILDEEIDILKLDLQGYELEALKGCDDLLDRIKMIDTEVEFITLYEGQPLFGDVDLFLRGKGFKLLNLYDLWTDPAGQLSACDAVYLNGRFF